MSPGRRTPIRDAMRISEAAHDDIHAHALGVRLQDSEGRLRAENASLNMQLRDLRQQHEQLSTWFMAAVIIIIGQSIAAWWWIR